MQQGKSRKKQYFWHSLRFLIAAGALYLAFNKVDWPQLGQLVSQIKIWVLLCALASYAASQLIFVARWCMFLKVQSIKIPYWAAVRLHFLGLFYSNALPSAVGGDLLRAWYVTKHTDRKLEAALSVVIDRIIGLSGLLIMAIAGYWFIPAQARNELLRQYAQMPLMQAIWTNKWLVTGLFAAAAVFGMIMILNARGRKIVRGLVAKVSLRAAETLSKTRLAVLIYYRKKMAILAGLLLTFCCQGVFIMGLWLIGQAIDANADWELYFVFFPVSWLLGTIPLTPGGVGVVEWAVRVMFEGAGVTTNHASALALAQRVLWILGSLPGAVIHLMGSHLPKDFSIDCNQSIN